MAVFIKTFLARLEQISIPLDSTVRRVVIHGSTCFKQGKRWYFLGCSSHVLCCSVLARVGIE